MPQQVRNAHTLLTGADGVQVSIPPEPKEWNGTPADWAIAFLESDGATVTDEVAAWIRGELAEPADAASPSLADWYREWSESDKAVVDGETFVFNAPPVPESVWGDGGTHVLMARGEGTMIVGPQGVGKSTLAQQIALKRIGIGDPDLLGYEVMRDPRKVLYLALDRPLQIARLWRRMASEGDRTALRERLVVCQGALPFPLRYDRPDQLAQWAHDLGAGLIVVDSYKDLAGNLSDESTGALINRIVQEVVVGGIDWLGLHHQRKAQEKNKKPNSLADVYGSTWLTSGLGSVIGLWGEAGDETVEFLHLKQPAETVEIGAVTTDHAKGVSRVAFGPQGHDAASKHSRKVVAELVSRGPASRITKDETASLLGVGEKTAQSILKALVDKGTIQPHGSTSDRSWGLTPALWNPAMELPAPTSVGRSVPESQAAMEDDHVPESEPTTVSTSGHSGRSAERHVPELEHTGAEGDLPELRPSTTSAQASTDGGDDHGPR